MPGDEADHRDNREASFETRFAPPSGSIPGAHAIPGADEALSGDSILNRVLEETIGEDTGPITSEEMESLQTVARRYYQDDQEPFGVDPIGIALVESLLSLRLSGFEPTDKKWHEMARTIATSFFESPPARLRLERLWDRLCATIS